MTGTADDENQEGTPVGAESAAGTGVRFSAPSPNLVADSATIAQPTSAEQPMPRLAANLTMLFNEIDFLDRFAAAANAGFTGVEYLFPYAYDSRVLRERLAAHGLTQALHNLPAGNWSAGERGIACHPDRVAEFEAGVEQAIEYATALGCTRVNCLAGIAPPGVESTRARETFVRNLKYAAPRFNGAGIQLLIEPINTRDIPGFFLSRTDQAVEIIAEVGSDNLFLQYDIYHMQIMEGDLATRLERHRSLIAHIQVADTPGRHEPGTGEINFPFLLSFIDRLGYDGWVGCEYKPAATTAGGLAWARPYLRDAVV
jgi:hydroxypyruvate isomerase